MKHILKNFLYSKFFIFVIAFFIGGLCHYFANYELMASDKISKTMRPLYTQPDWAIDSDEIDLSPFFKNNLDKKFDFKTQEQLNISLSEDDNFKYVEVITNDQNSKNLKIDIKDGFINVQSEMKDTKVQKNERGNSYSAYLSSFSRSFNIPEGVDEKKVEIVRDQKKNDRILIKFPKIKYTT